MISTHVLDTSRGLPAAGITVRLEMLHQGTWGLIATATTNGDGRIQYPQGLQAGEFRLTFEVEKYFGSLKQECFFPSVTVHFRFQDTTRNYHVPLLLNPFGYSTYRGS